MPIRPIIKIDESKCNGCGQCIVDCAEGALAIVDGKAKLVKDSFCDGLGACIGNCPTGALTLEDREAPEFELPPEMAQTSAAHAPGITATAAAGACPGHHAPAPGGGCPGSRSFQFTNAAPAPAAAPESVGVSALTHWPIQLHLVNFQAPHFQERDIVIASDCSAFACGSFHPRLLQGKAIAIACPKLDDPSGYHEKLVDMFQTANPRSVSVVRMEVPCCRGIVSWVLAARDKSGKGAIPVEEIIVGVEGAIVSRSVY